jgi:hypothetical protein
MNELSSNFNHLEELFDLGQILKALFMPLGNAVQWVFYAVEI